MRASDVAPPASSALPSTTAVGDLSLDRSCIADVDDAMTAARVDVVLEMTAPLDADGVPGPSKVTRAEVRRALDSCHGDVSRAVDDILSLVAIKTLREEEQRTLAARRTHSTLALHELCSSLGLDRNSSFIALLEQLPEAERDGLLATEGAFVQQVLLCLEEEEEGEGERAGAAADAAVDADVHPLQLLLELFPDYKVDVVEDVLDRHQYDVNKAAEALQHLQALDHVQSYATVVSADARAAARHQELVLNGPDVESLGHFPALATGSKHSVPTQQVINPLKQQRRRAQESIQVRLQGRPPPKPLPLSIAFPTLPARDHVGKGSEVAANGAWDHRHRLESSITTQLKLERLKKLLPSVSSSVIHTTFMLNGCSSDATEAALREVYNLPLVGQHSLPPSAAEEMEVAAEAEEEIAAAKTACKLRQGGQTESWTLVSSKHKVNAAREKLSSRYCDVLASFRRGQHVLASERIRELSTARREHREAQRQWAHEYFLAHEEHLKYQRPIDLHGMIVMEALWVAREAIEYCQTHRIRRCLLICGVGHHSIHGKPRILTALQLSLSRRQIASRELHGVVTVFPLRSTDLL